MLESERDYERFGISDNDAESFVEDNLVTAIIKELEESNAATLLGQGKPDFIHWLKKLEKGDISLDISDEFQAYLETIPDELFTVKIKPRDYRVLSADQQTEEELDILADDDLRFDRLYKIARKRKSGSYTADALKLLSSVVEKNAADIQAIRDVAMTAIDWNMGDHAYYMMRRIIDWREGEALAYLTAADALAKAGYIDLSLIYYYICINADWDSDYGSLKTIAEFNCLKYLNELSDTSKYKITPKTREFMAYLKEDVESDLASEGFDDVNEADLIVVVSWNINNTDIDLHVIEPTGEKCYYRNRNTEIGGRLSIDVTRGYGPEMYVLKKAMPGMYSILLDYYSDSGTQTASKAKAYIDIYRDWGRANEKVTHKVVELRSGNWNDYNLDEDKRKTVMSFKIKE